MLIGTRYALERRRGRASVPVATALVGTVAAVTALVASVVFGASLSTLLATPRLYGINWQVSMQNLTGFQVHSLARALNANPTVDKVSYGVVGKLVDVNGVSTPAFMTDVSKGPMAFTLVDGRYPSGDHETALGTKTLASAHASVGSTVQVKIVTNKGHTVVRQFRVVGEVVLPPGNSPAIGVGAVLSVRAAVLALCPPTLSAARCTSQFEPLILKQATWFAVIGTVPGRRGDATVASLEARYAPYLSEIVVPTNLVNFGQAINFPALLGLTLALFGVATLAHLLLVSVSRRRKEVALLKVLGFVRRQVSAAVCWQATTVCLIGIVVGVPVGIIVGRSTWELFATAVGVEPVAVVPAQQVVVVAIGAIVVGNILAVVPAALAARLRPAEALRAT
jgi:hypothetical protein